MAKNIYIIQQGLLRADDDEERGGCLPRHDGLVDEEDKTFGSVVAWLVDILFWFGITKTRDRVMGSTRSRGVMLGVR